MKLVTDVYAQPRPADVARATFVVAVAELLRALAECENLPQPVMDAANEVRNAVRVFDGGYVRPRP